MAVERKRHLGRGLQCRIWHYSDLSYTNTHGLCVVSCVFMVKVYLMVCGSGFSVVCGFFGSNSSWMAAMVGWLLRLKATIACAISCGIAMAIVALSGCMQAASSQHVNMCVHARFLQYGSVCPPGLGGCQGHIHSCSKTAPWTQ